MYAIDKSKLTGGNDILFKAIMYEQPQIFKKILELVLETKIHKIMYLSSELPVQTFIEKGKRLDIYIDTIDALVDVEVSTDYKKEILNRNLSFGFSIYCQQVKKGNGYDAYKPIKIINFIFDKNGKSEERHGYIIDKKTGDVMTEMLQYSEFYIENYLEKYYNKVKR